MLRPLLCVPIIFCLATTVVRAADYTERQGREAWAQWKTRPVTESNFRAVCDLVQDVGKSNIQLGYQILAEYLPMVKATGNKGWVHVLLMGWAKAKESLTAFGDAEKLYREARENAAGDPRHYDEALVGTVLLYADWGRMDSLDKYVRMGKKAAAGAGDKENLSFVYTFSSLAHLTDTAALGKNLQEAIRLADGLPDKNALFTARYNYASIYLRNDPQQQATEFSALLDLAKDPTLSHKPRLYERTAFSFRNPASNIYLQLMQINLLLADYDNAWKFGEMLYDAVVRPNPSAPQAPFFNTELAMVRAYQGEYASAKDYLQTSLRLFNVPEEKVPYPSYFLAAGMVAEHERRIPEAVHYYELAYRMGPMEGLHLMPSELYYAHGLILAHRLEEAQRVLSTLEPALNVRKYTAYGFYYYKHDAELLKAKGDYPGYARALETFYAIKDSLASLHHYRAIQEIEARVRLRDKEQQIARLHEVNVRDRVYFAVTSGLGIVIVLLLAGYIRNRVRQMRKQHRIDVMQGALDAEENERHKIADQLHDEVGGMLALATLNVSSTLEKGRDDVQAGEKLGKAQEILSSVSVTIRELSHRLTPIVIEKYGFAHAVEDMAHSVNISGRLQVQTVVVGFQHTDGYSPVFLKDCYRILQELLQNILKHAHATEALLEAVEHPAEAGRPGQVSILVEDNGVGVTEGPHKGKGLTTIRSKIAYLNGRIEISRKQEGGTLVVIELPIKAN